jgi:hypothetical protein
LWLLTRRLEGDREAQPRSDPLGFHPQLLDLVGHAAEGKSVCELSRIFPDELPIRSSADSIPLRELRGGMEYQRLCNWR